MKTHTKTTFFLILTLLHLHCSSQSIQKNDPQALYTEAEEAIKNEHYQIALEQLRDIKNKFPYSPLAVIAQLRIADTYFLQESYIEAAASYEAFRELHPKHPKMSYAFFQEGKSYFNAFPRNTARDMNDAQKALTIFNHFLSTFPDAPEKDEVNQDIAIIKELLAKKELNIGDFYYKRKFFNSAETRYKKLLELYPDTQSAKLAEDALQKINIRHNTP